MKIEDLEKDLDKRTLYLYQGKAWAVDHFFTEPSVTMICVGTQEKISFGINSLISSEFKRIQEHKNGNT